MIENRLQTQNGPGGISTGAVISIKRRNAACRLHHNHVVEAPVRTGILAGVVICTAEAEQTRNLIIRLLAVNLKENHSDLPQLPHELPEAR